MTKNTQANRISGEKTGKAQKEVRTRFAPSPTGFLHVGGARTALFNYLYAKANGGKFILRIEDTDQNRSSLDSFKTIMESMEWLGLHPDEGPMKGGKYGPYTQSERLGIYKEYTDQLIREKKAYRCFCTPAELESKKKHAESMGIPYLYDGLHTHMPDEEVQEKLDQGIPYSIRFKAPSKTIIVEDHIQGKVKFDTKLIGDFIIVKSDGFPSYNYAVVIDDWLMKISHIIRGVGHLSNTPRQILIHEAFGWDLPEYAHVSEIVGLDGKKLSKRAGATSILAFRDMGYLSEAFENYMALLGWSPENNQEYFPGRSMEQVFDINRCSKSPSTFDVFKKQKSEDEEKDLKALTMVELAEQLNPKSKLNWLANKYIRDAELFYLTEKLIPFIKNEPGIPEKFKDQNNEELQSIVDSIRVYLDRLSQAPPYIAEFFKEKISLAEDAKEWLASDEFKKVASQLYSLLQNATPINADDYTAIFAKTGEVSGQKGKSLYMPIRAVTTGKMHGLELPVLFSLLGKEKVLLRIEMLAKEAGFKL